LVTRNFNPTALPGEKANETVDGSYKFDYKSQSGKDYGTAVAMINDEGLTLYFGDNLGKGMDASDKDGWFNFLSQLKNLAMINRLPGFHIQDISKLKYTMQGQAAIKEGLFESWAGTKTRSWNGMETEARLMIKHKRVIGENDARYRYIESLFVETAEGERYKLPFTKLVAGRAMVEHVRQGGKPYDIRGNHIAQIVEEMNVLSRFKRANQGKIFEGVTAELVESAGTYYENLQHNLKSLSTRGGYARYFEAWDPAAITDEDVIIEDLRHMFIEQNIDSRVEQALPLLAKLQREQAMKEANIFESWANLILEGTIALPDTKEKQAQLIELLSQELPVGPEAINVTEQLADLFNDDELFDRLNELARENADADARDIILERLNELKDHPDVAQVIGQLANQSDEEEVDEGVGKYIAGLGAAAAIGAGGYGLGAHKSNDNGFSNPPSSEWTQSTSQKQKPVAAPVAKKQGNGFSNPPPKSWTNGSGESRLINKKDDFEEGSEDPLIQLRRSAGMKDEGVGRTAGEIAGAAAGELVTLGPGNPLSYVVAPALSYAGGEAGDWAERKIRGHGDEHAKDYEDEDEEVDEMSPFNLPNDIARGIGRSVSKAANRHYDNAVNAPEKWLDKKLGNPEDVDEGAFARALSHLGGIGGAAFGHKVSKGNEHGAKSGYLAGKAIGDTAGQYIDNKVNKWLNRSPSDSSATDDDNFDKIYTPKKQTEPAKEKPAATASTEKKPRTGGKKPGETSETPEAKRKREARAKAKSGKTSDTAPAMSESGNWLEGQYGHSGKMKPVTGGDADTIDRLKFLSGITK
jgi:hypothetical protein